MKAPVKTQMTQEPEYGNRMMYAELQNPAAGEVEFTLEYKVTRREYSRGDYAQLEHTDRKPGVVLASMNRLIAPDSLIPTNGKIKKLAVEITGSQTGTVAKAKAAYDYLFSNMRYDKTGSGRGRGDAVWACDAKRGNCTDFHSPFIGMLRADGIPARFDIGFPLPENKHKRDIAGYHCCPVIAIETRINFIFILRSLARNMPGANLPQRLVRRLPSRRQGHERIVSRHGHGAPDSLGLEYEAINLCGGWPTRGLQLGKGGS